MTLEDLVSDWVEELENISFGYYKVEALLENFQEAYVDKDYDKGLSLADIILSKSPKNKDVLFKKAEMFYSTRKYKSAVEFYDEYLELNDNNHVAWLHKAISLDRIGFYEEALKSYNKAGRTSSKDDLLRRQGKAVLELKFGKPAEAFQLFMTFLEDQYYPGWDKKEEKIYSLVESSSWGKENSSEAKGKISEMLSLDEACFEMIRSDYEAGKTQKAKNKFQDLLFTYNNNFWSLRRDIDLDIGDYEDAFYSQEKIFENRMYDYRTSEWYYRDMKQGVFWEIKDKNEFLIENFYNHVKNYLKNNFGWLDRRDVLKEIRKDKNHYVE